MKRMIEVGVLGQDSKVCTVGGGFTVRNFKQEYLGLP